MPSTSNNEFIGVAWSRNIRTLKEPLSEPSAYGITGWGIVVEAGKFSHEIPSSSYKPGWHQSVKFMSERRAFGTDDEIIVSLDCDAQTLRLQTPGADYTLKNLPAGKQWALMFAAMYYDDIQFLSYEP